MPDAIPGTRPSVVVISDDWVFPTNAGGRVEILGECLALREAGFDVVLVVSVRESVSLDDVRAHQSICERLVVLRRSGLAQTSLRRPWWPYQLASRVPTEAQRQQLAGVLDGTEVAVVSVHEWSVPIARAINAATRLPVLLRSQNDQIQYLTALRKNAGFTRKLYFTAERVRFRWVFRGLLADVREVAVISGPDASVYESLGLPTFVLPPVLDPTEREAEERTPPPDSGILFIGALDMPHSVAGLLWFANKVLPAVRAEVPDAELTVIGRRPSPDIREALVPLPGVRFMGEKRHVDVAYRNARVFVNPIFSGSGVNMKMGPPAFHGVPIVTTSVGIRGLPAFVGAARVADDAKGFAQNVVELLQDDGAWSKASMLVQESLNEHRPAKIGEQLAGAIRRIKARGSVDIKSPLPFGGDTAAAEQLG